MEDKSENPALIDVRASELREEIKRGTYGASGVGRIPTVSALAKKWKTTRSTAYAVVQLLQSEGIIYQHNNSLIVNLSLISLEGITKNFETYLKDRGHEVTITNVIEPAIEIMPKDIAQIFGQEDGVHVVHRMRKQGLNDLPLRLAENWYPASLAGEFLDQMRQNDKMDVIGAIRDKHNLFIVRSKDVVIARVPTPFEARQLDLVRTEPVVEIRRSNFAADGTALMWNKIIHRGPQFQFTYEYPVNHWK